MTASDASMDEMVTWPANAQRLALIVGCNNSSSIPPNWATLHSAEKDAGEVAYLLEKRTCGFKLLRPALVGKDATVPNIRQAVQDLVKRRTEQDFLLFYFSGHAQPMKNDEIFFVTYDFDKERVELDPSWYFSMRWLWNVLYKTKDVGGILIILDCCYAGNMLRAGEDFLQIDLRTRLEEWDSGERASVPQNRFRLILAATGYNVEAEEVNGHGWMTKWLIHALEGDERIMDVEGNVDVYSLHRFLLDHMLQEQISPLSGEVAKKCILARHPKLSVSYRKAQDATMLERIYEKVSVLDQHVNSAATNTKSKSQPFDRLLCVDATFADLDQGRVADFLNKEMVLKEDNFLSGGPVQEQLVGLDLLRNSHPTYGALLCFGQDLSQWLPSAITRCIDSTTNNSPDRWEASKKYRSGLLRQFDESLSFLVKRLNSSRFISEEGGVDQLEIPRVVLREALANALIHREYEDRTDCVVVEIYSDRIEISNPGDLPTPMTLEMLEKKHGSHPRNPQIANIFYLYGYVEERGSGIERMRLFMKDAGLPAPKFNISEDKRFSIILYRPSKAPFDEALLIPPEYFVGREEDLQWLLQRLRGGGVAKITALQGMGGIGKTALAAIAVHQMRAEGYFRDGIVVELCQNQTDSVIIVRRILARFHPQRRQPETNDPSELIEIAHRLLDGKDVLIVLDNIEPKLDLEAVVKPLLAASVTVLLTARHSLPHNVVSVEGSRKLDLLSVEEATDLFAQIFKQRTADELKPTEYTAIKDIITALDRHTLAVKIAGAYALDYERPLQELAKELKDSQQILDLPDGEILQVLALVFARSTDDLPAEAQHLFTALAAFASAGFGRQAVLALGRSLKLVSPNKAIDMLVRRALVDASVNYDVSQQSDRERLRLHPLVRAFAEYKFAQWQQSERDAAYHTIANYYAQYTSSISHLGPALRNLGLNADDANIIGALQWAYARGENALVTILCSHMYPFWRDLGRTNESLQYLPLGIAAAAANSKARNKQEDRLREADLAISLGQVHRLIAELDKAEQIFKSNLAIRREIDDLQGEGVVLAYLGRLAQSRGRLDEAEDYCQQALVLHHKTGNRLEESVDLDSLGELAYTRGKFEEAKSYFEQALAIQREVQHQRGIGITLCFLGMVSQGLGLLEEAKNYFEEALTFNRSIQSRIYEGITHREWGYLDYANKRLKEAEYHYQEALAIAQETSDRQSEVVLLSRIAALTADQGDLKHAEELYRRGLTMGMNLQYTPRVADICTALGCFLIEKRGNKEEGCSMLLDALNFYKLMNISFKELEARNIIQQLGCEKKKKIS